MRAWPRLVLGQALLPPFAASALVLRWLLSFRPSIQNDRDLLVVRKAFQQIVVQALMISRHDEQVSRHSVPRPFVDDECVKGRYVPRVEAAKAAPYDKLLKLLTTQNGRRGWTARNRKNSDAAGGQVNSDEDLRSSWTPAIGAGCKNF